MNRFEDMMEHLGTIRMFRSRYGHAIRRHFPDFPTGNQIRLPTGAQETSLARSRGGRPGPWHSQRRCRHPVEPWP